MQLTTLCACWLIMGPAIDTAPLRLRVRLGSFKPFIRHSVPSQPTRLGAYMNMPTRDCSRPIEAASPSMAGSLPAIPCRRSL